VGIRREENVPIQKDFSNQAKGGITMTQYTGKERVIAACKGEFADRVPINVMVPRAHELLGFSALEVTLDPDKGLQALVKAQEMFPSDMVPVPGAPALPSTAAATYEAKHGSGAMEEPRLADKSAFAELKLRDPKQSKRWVAFLEMCYKTNATFGDSWTYSLMAGPWTTAVTLRGAEAIIMDTMDDPQFIHNLMRYTTETAKLRGDSIIETGLALFIAEPSSSCSIISPGIYQEFVHPYLKEVIDHLKQNKALIELHICGNTTPILEYTTSLDVDILDIDAATPLEKAIEVAQKRLAIRGNLSPELFGEGTREQIEEEVKHCFEVAASGGAYILSPGCTIPYETPLENVRYFWEAATKYGSYQKN